MIVTFGGFGLDSTLSGTTDFSGGAPLVVPPATLAGTSAAGGAATSGQLQVVYKAIGDAAAGGASVDAILSAPGAGAPLSGWDVPISSGLGNVLFPREIAYDNAITLLIGPIRGLNTATGAAVLWPGMSISGFVSATEFDNVPLGGIVNTYPMVAGKAQSVEYFTASEITTALDAAAALAPLVPGQRLYVIVSGGSDFRRAVPFVYRAAIQTA